MLRVILAGIFSLIFPGIGQIFNGQWLKGIALAVVELSVIYFIIPNTWIMILFRLIWLYAIIDAIVVALRVRKGVSKSKGLTGINAIAGVGISMLLILPLAWLPKFLPDIVYSLAARSHDIIEQNVPDEQFEEEKERYKNHLEEKYNESFVLGEGSYSTSFEHFVIDAYPEGHEDEQFVVYQDEYGEYDDTYIGTKWKIEAEGQFDPFIHSLYEDLWTYDLDILFLGDDVIVDDNDQLLSFEEGVKESEALYHYNLNIHVFKNMNDENKNAELERIFKVITFLKDNNIQANRVQISYYDEELSGKINENTVPDSGEHRDFTLFFLSLGHKKIEEITSPNDIEKHLVDLRK